MTVLLRAWRDGDGTALEGLIPLVHELLAMSARLMRRVLVDPARLRRAVKRGGSAVRVMFDETAMGGVAPDADVIPCTGN